jgi:hypothetical protein
MTHPDLTTYAQPKLAGGNVGFLGQGILPAAFHRGPLPGIKNAGAMAGIFR